MPENIVPITELNKVGVIKDTPPIGLPPQALTDIQNMRFDNGATNKIQGEMDVISSTRLAVDGEIVYTAYWQNPNIGPDHCYYLVVARNNNFDKVYVVSTDTDVAIHDLDVSFPVIDGHDWQHTQFQGGYAVVLNNGTARPQYILDATGNTDITALDLYELPGWDSYHALETTINAVYNSDVHTPEFDLGRLVDFDVEEVLVDVIDGDTGSRDFRVTFTALENTLDSGATIALDPRTNTHTITLSVDTDAENHIVDNDQIIMTFRSKNIVQVRAAVVEAWGDTLVAGGLTEVNSPGVSTAATDGSTATLTLESESGLGLGDVIKLNTGEVVTLLSASGNQITFAEPDGFVAGNVTGYSILRGGKVVRNLPGIIRISDVAAPGSIPHNWNPYAVGVSTADEFQLSTTGVVRDVAELQGNLYVYTDNSIHSITRTGNPNVPYVTQVVTTSKGALTNTSVLEFNGAHIVVGSNDIYTFSGHPSSIKSIAEDRIQDYFYKNLSPDNYDNIFILNNIAKQEVWIGYPKGDSTLVDEILIWSYKYNVWSIRRMTEVVTATIAPTYTLSDGTLSDTLDPSVLRPVLTTADEIFGADFDVYTLRDGTEYESYLERVEVPLSPEFDTEYLNSVALWVDKETTDTIPLQLRFRTSDYPGNKPTDLADGSSGPSNPPFTIGDEYKADVRLNGRFYHYRISDGGAEDFWNISGIQLAINKGGRR